MNNPSSLSIEYLRNSGKSISRMLSLVPSEWRQYFQDVTAGDGHDGVAVRPVVRRATTTPPAISPAVSHVAARETEIAWRQDCLGLLLRAYRERGHLVLASTRSSRRA